MDLEIDYKQWLFITTDLYNYIYNEISNEKCRECRNIFQHWLIMVNQSDNIKKYKYYPLLPEIQANDEDEYGIVTALVNAIAEKNFFWKNNNDKAKEAVHNILKHIAGRHSFYKYEGLQLVPFRKDGLLCLEKFQCKNFVNLPYLMKNFDDFDVIRMILRYESMGNGSYQWGDPKELHMLLYNEYRVMFEGFASPFNSRFIGLDDCKFCSLFPDTDAVFGSLGNFFKLDLKQYPGAWTVNPPFVNNIMNEVSDKIIDALASGVKSTFFCTYPRWNDSTGWKKLQQSKYLRDSFHREKNIVIQDAYGRVFEPYMGMSLFCLSYNSQLNLEKIYDYHNKGLNEFDTSYNAKLSLNK